MDRRDAVRKAKAYVQDVFADEGVINIRLEELNYDDVTNEWMITVGFFSDHPAYVVNGASIFFDELRPTRRFKIVRIRDADEYVTGMKDRLIELSE